VVADAAAVVEMGGILFASCVHPVDPLVDPFPFHPLEVADLPSFALEEEAFHLLVSYVHALGEIVLWEASYLVEEDVDHQDLQEVGTFWVHLGFDHASYLLDVLVGDIVCLEEGHQEDQEEVD